MRRPAAWTIDGPWVTANKALELLRGEGYFAGMRAAWERDGRAVHASKNYQYNDAVQGFIDRVVRVVREESETPGPVPSEGHPSEFVLVVTACTADSRVDPDAAAIVSKWILDGLNKSGVIKSEKQIVGVFHRTTLANENIIEFSLQEPGEFWT